MQPIHRACKQATNWWNNLPITLISGSATKFSRELYYIPDCLHIGFCYAVCFCILFVLYLAVIVYGCFCGSCILVCNVCS